jgi:hypothetical protein
VAQNGSTSFLSRALPALLLVGGMAVATHSVVRYKLWIVVTYTVLAVLLAAWVLLEQRTAVATGDAAVAERRRSPALPVAGAVAATLLLAAVLQLTVRPYTYLTMSEGWLVRWVYAASAVLSAVAVLGSVRLQRRRLADAGLAIAVLGYLIAAVLLIHDDPTPKIDVWVMLQQTADGILHGKDMYTQNWTGSPGVQDAFTYLPFTGLLLAPGRWLAGDVRWALVVVTLLGVLAVRLLGRRPAPVGAAQPSTTGEPPVTPAETSAAEPSAAEPSAAEAWIAEPSTASAGPSAGLLAAVGAGALLLLLPGTATQVEQAWTEPLLMACLAGWALGVQRRNTVLAVLCLALGVASKQHLFVMLPVLAAWPAFGPRRAVFTAGLAGIFVLPWFIASPADMWHDAVTVLINFQPLIFADTLYIASINSLHRTPPFWLTGAAILITLAGAIITVRRRSLDLSSVLRWCALVLFVANLVNKQAFYNQYWLVAALVVISFAVPPATGPDDDAPAAELISPAERPSPREGAEV